MNRRDSRDLQFLWDTYGELEKEGKVKNAALGGTTKTILTLMPSKQAADSVFGTKMTRQEMKRRISVKRRSMNQIYPDAGDVKKLSEQGVDVYNLDDEEEQQHAMETIRKLPCPLSVKKEFSKICRKYPVVVKKEQ